MHLYRIANEAIINARRHADASCIQVRLGRRDGALEMTVQDDGVGLPNDLDEAKGLGLRTMRYRANLIGASLTLRAPDEGDGTILRCTLPLDGIEAE
jgi:signal transduction histidine kinase